jgi:hypothetical protein
LERTGGGFAVDPAQVDQVAAVLATLYRDWETGGLGAHAANPQAFQCYERGALAGELATLFGG